MSQSRQSARPLPLGPLLLLLGLAAGCGRSPVDPVDPAHPGDAAADRNASPGREDPLGEGVDRVVYPDQGWSPADSRRFYWTSQGSQIMPYDWFLALEQADSEKPFRSQENLLRYRYLPQKPDSSNPDGLPVGFVKDSGAKRDWFGFTCAACHTGEVHYKKVAYRIDGGPSLADTTGFLTALTAAIKATQDRPEKFDRFAAKVLGKADSAEARSTLTSDLAVIAGRRKGYDSRNFPPGKPAGNGRIDAFGAIQNEVFHRAAKPDEPDDSTASARPADAPVSIPFLWDTPQHDIVQWNGAAKNTPRVVGPLGRNVGEVLGVFGDFDIPEHPSILGYRSSVQVDNLKRMEEWLTTLWSPQWPAEFPAIDAGKRDRGKVLYDQNCVKCHDLIDRKSPTRKVIARMEPTGTDPLMAMNFDARRGRSGKLEGAFSRFLPLIPGSTKIGPEAAGAELLGNAVIGTIVGSWREAPKDELGQFEYRRGRSTSADITEGPDLGPPYKGRPLNGIWATAPYLHNGSVPTLYDLLSPAEKRPEHFGVGSREFDTEKVGLKTTEAGFFTFRVRDEKGQLIPGNSNAGHAFGAKLNEGERLDLLEYLKSL
ncbi:hypothetical protein OJF2_53980 [Aquisphaera giovannonii]|uniref:Cytochrome c domain-containing protein n=1 Tax=Aquisphaera giovannonii TaxID=406548 RepID=A0A5B9W8B2_9BACT|nr:di-heme-cytochrome C peroxidase [Aquisphaera giovannonii]QEH36813.1 hypothetical protein OJF2_53980 [Aquisphaera giovannonii]